MQYKNIHNVLKTYDFDLFEIRLVLMVMNYTKKEDSIKSEIVDDLCEYINHIWTRFGGELDTIAYLVCNLYTGREPLLLGSDRLSEAELKNFLGVDKVKKLLVDD